MRQIQGLTYLCCPLVGNLVLSRLLTATSLFTQLVHCRHRGYISTVFCALSTVPTTDLLYSSRVTIYHHKLALIFATLAASCIALINRPSKSHHPHITPLLSASRLLLPGEFLFAGIAFFHYRIQLWTVALVLPLRSRPLGAFNCG